jgi:hypothetical protein
MAFSATLPGLAQSKDGLPCAVAISLAAKSAVKTGPMAADRMAVKVRFL